MTWLLVSNVLFLPLAKGFRVRARLSGNSQGETVVAPSFTDRLIDVLISTLLELCVAQSTKWLAASCVRIKTARVRQGY